jgi:hypothetical protein
VARDASVLDASEMDVARAMGRHHAFATLLAIGPLAAATRAALLDHARAARLHERADVIAASNRLGDDGAIMRVAAARIEPLLTFVRAALAPLRTALVDDPFARKW